MGRVLIYSNYLQIIYFVINCISIEILLDFFSKQTIMWHEYDPRNQAKTFSLFFK